MFLRRPPLQVPSRMENGILVPMYSGNSVLQLWALSPMLQQVRGSLHPIFHRALEQEKSLQLTMEQKQQQT